jgi:hypothetical protein
MRIEIKGFIFACPDVYGKMEEPTYRFYDWDVTERSDSFQKYVKVCEHTLVAEIPDNFDPRPGLVANLERERERVQAEFTKRVTEINAQIQSLLAIEA